MKYFLFTLLVCTTVYAQVGIGTNTPSPASMLDINSTLDSGLTYHGLMPPRIPLTTDLSRISASVIDVGLLVFVEETSCLKIWNGSVWENIHCTNDLSFRGVVQNFDLGNSWGYVTDISFFDNGTDGFYGITTASNSIFSNLNSLTNNFLGIRDLDDEGVNGTTGLATVTFDTINISSSISGVDIVFDYQTFRLDNGDDAFYTIVIDGIAQTTQQFINGVANSSNFGTILISIPGGTSTVALILQFQQNGPDDVLGFDNFRLIPN